MNKIFPNHSFAFLCLAVTASFSVTFAQADSGLPGGRAELGVLFDRETSTDKSQVNDAVTFTPALAFHNGAVSKIELLLTAQRDKDSSAGTDTFSQFYGAAIRVRKDVELVNQWGMYFRGLVGRTLGDTNRYLYGYSDAALTYRLGLADLMLGVQVQRALDGTTDQDFNRLRLGPVFNIGDAHSIEINWVRSWKSNSNSVDRDSAMVQYIYKF